MHFFSISVSFVAHKVNSFIRKYDHSIKNAVLHIRYPFNKPIAKHKHVQLTCRVDQSTSGVTSPSIPPSIRRCVAQVVVTFIQLAAKCDIVGGRPGPEAKSHFFAISLLACLLEPLLDTRIYDLWNILEVPYDKTGMSVKAFSC